MSTIRPLLVVAIAVLAAACSGDGVTLFGTVWQWNSRTELPVDGQGVNPSPDDYTIEFKTDGTFVAKADCNQVAGSYTTTDRGAITLMPGPSTACGGESLDQLFLDELRATVSYATANSQLTLTQDDGGTMTFE